MPSHRFMPKSAWRTIKNWSDQSFLRIAENLKIDVRQMNRDNGRTWTALVLETDFCPQCQTAFCAFRNPKMVNSCGHTTCQSCSDIDTANCVTECLVCKRCALPKVGVIKTKVRLLTFNRSRSGAYQHASWKRTAAG
jgi:hypothetical protein